MAEKKTGVLAKFKTAFQKSGQALHEGLGRLLLGEREIDDDLLENIETQLLLADVGMEATLSVIDALTKKISRKELENTTAVYEALKKELVAILYENHSDNFDIQHTPHVMLMVGVNGVGKTTTIGKLASRYQAQGKQVMLAAGDTFRAAAVEQLKIWGQRNDVPVIAQHTGADSASVIFDAVASARSKKTDILLADTAGRLPNKPQLMDELEKIVRVMKKVDEHAPHDILLVLDATTGQNALIQAQTFQKAVGVTGIVLTKLDGSAKGGIVFAISKQLGIPIRYIGVGEQADDLRPFDPKVFLDVLFESASL